MANLTESRQLTAIKDRLYAWWRDNHEPYTDPMTLSISSVLGRLPGLSALRLMQRAEAAGLSAIGTYSWIIFCDYSDGFGPTSDLDDLFRQFKARPNASIMDFCGAPMPPPRARRMRPIVEPSPWVIDPAWIKTDPSVPEGYVRFDGQDLPITAPAAEPKLESLDVQLGPTAFRRSGAHDYPPPNSMPFVVSPATGPITGFQLDGPDDYDVPNLRSLKFTISVSPDRAMHALTATDAQIRAATLNRYLDRLRANAVDSVNIRSALAELPTDFQDALLDIEPDEFLGGYDYLRFLRHVVGIGPWNRDLPRSEYDAIAYQIASLWFESRKANQPVETAALWRRRFENFYDPSNDPENQENLLSVITQLSGRGAEPAWHAIRQANLNPKDAYDWLDYAWGKQKASPDNVADFSEAAVAQWKADLTELAAQLDAAVAEPKPYTVDDAINHFLRLPLDDETKRRDRDEIMSAIFGLHTDLGVAILLKATDELLSTAILLDWVRWLWAHSQPLSDLNTAREQGHQSLQSGIRLAYRRWLREVANRLSGDSTILEVPTYRGNVFGDRLSAGNLAMLNEEVEAYAFCWPIAHLIIKNKAPRRHIDALLEWCAKTNASRDLAVRIVAQLVNHPSLHGWESPYLVAVDVLNKCGIVPDGSVTAGQPVNAAPPIESLAVKLTQSATEEEAPESGDEGGKLIRGIGLNGDGGWFSLESTPQLGAYRFEGGKDRGNGGTFAFNVTGAELQSFHANLEDLLYTDRMPTGDHPNDPNTVRINKDQTLRFSEFGAWLGLSARDGAFSAEYRLTPRDVHLIRDSLTDWLDRAAKRPEGFNAIHNAHRPVFETMPAHQAERAEPGAPEATGKVLRLGTHDRTYPDSAPALVYRDDLMRWSLGTVAGLENATKQLAYLEALLAPGETIELWCSPKIGGIAVLKSGRYVAASARSEPALDTTRVYVGFFDLSTGMLTIYDGSPAVEDLIMRFAAHNPLQANDPEDGNAIAISHEGTVEELVRMGILPEQDAS